MSHTWIVVANSTRARIFASDGPDEPLTEVHDLVHPGSRLHERRLKSDLPGRAFDSVGQGRHLMEKEDRPKRHEAHVFAREIADFLHTARSRGEFVDLVLVVAPEFLGLLRESLDAPTRAVVREELAKNIVALDPHDIRARLVERIA